MRGVLRLVLASAAIAGTICVACQERPVLSPAQEAAHQKFGELMSKSEILMNAGNPAKALPFLLEAAALEDRAGLGNDAKAALAQAYAESGRSDDAIGLYRKLFVHGLPLMAAAGELRFLAGYAAPPAMEYAILLARRGWIEEAIAMYYTGLRNMNMRGFDPMRPITVIFHPDPNWLWWQPSAKGVEAVATFAKARMSHPERRLSITRAARKLAPTWFLPVLYEANLMPFGAAQSELLNLAQKLAKPGVEAEVTTNFRALLKELGSEPRMSIEGYMSKLLKSGIDSGALEAIRPSVAVLRRITSPARKE